MLTDTTKSYGWLSIGLHWITAILTLGLFAVGLYMVDLGYYDAGYYELPRWHIGWGLVLGALMLPRLVWRLAHRGKPEPLPQHSKPIRWVSKSVQSLFYLLIFIMIGSGYLITTAKGDPAKLFDWAEIPATVQLSSAWVDRMGELHLYAGWAIVILAGLHSAAALLHHFWFRDNTLKRMLKPQ